VASDSHPGNAKQGASKASKPKADLKSTNVDSPPKGKAVVDRDTSRSSTQRQGQEIVDVSTTRASRGSNTGRDTSASLTPLPAEENPIVPHGSPSRAGDGDSREADITSSTIRRNPRTYAKSQAAKTVKTAFKSGEDEDVSRDDVIPAHGSEKKRKAEAAIQLPQEAKKHRTGKFDFEKTLIGTDSSFVSAGADSDNRTRCSQCFQWQGKHLIQVETQARQVQACPLQ
jgi:hypothetical protein